MSDDPQLFRVTYGGAWAGAKETFVRLGEAPYFPPMIFIPGEGTARFTMTIETVE